MSPTVPGFQPVHVTRDGVFINGEKLPGLIAKDGIVLVPGGARTYNRLVVTFVVGEVKADDPTVITTKEADE
jgi:hypothetical protein